MSEAEEIKQPETEAIPADDPPEETVGEIMQKMSGEGLKYVVIVGFAIAYVAGIVYAEVHGLTMLQKGVVPDMRIWATLGMVAAGLCALLFPIALKVWAIEARHRITAIIFYVIDFAFLSFNAITDFNTQQGQTLVPWAHAYVTYILPSSPIILAGMITILFSLDPAVREKIMLATLRAAMKEKMARKVADAAKGANVTATVNAAAEREVDRALSELFGHPVTRGYILNTDESNPGRLEGLAGSFFGWLSRLVQSDYSPVTPSRSQESSLDEPTNNPNPPQP